jgi:hypothetical protein
MGLFDRKRTLETVAPMRGADVAAQIGPAPTLEAFYPFGGADYLATREEAMGVPALARARNMICNSIATIPLITRDKATGQIVDQPVVRAAKQGRVLILDGLEKAERNVLPTLNNLLENREMNLDDGSVLISHDNYEKIVKNDNSSIKKSQLIPVNENFFVISLVTPTPPYVSSTSISLDPPLRSRFQCRYID